MSEKSYLIVGAGFAGMTLAERITAAGHYCTIIEKRNHIGGNAHDYHDENGVLIHAYGPHYFRSNSQGIIEYLTRFTSWRPVSYKVLSFTDGRYWSFPVNLQTFEQLIGRDATEAEFIAWLDTQRVPCKTPRNSEELLLSQIGPRLYELFFRGYTLKQWKREPRELDASVCGRIPIRTNRNDAYLNEMYQMLPADGYHKLFNNLLAACGERLTLLLNTDYRDIVGRYRFTHVFYTGPIDEYYNYRFGPLPYRSLRFDREHIRGAALAARAPISGKPAFWQPELQVNYPNDFDFTRIVEMKHATGQQCEGSTIVREYPLDWTLGAEPYYPVPGAESKAIYEKYRSLAVTDAGVTFLGRLGTYQYYNMDQVVAQALTVARTALT